MDCQTLREQLLATLDGPSLPAVRAAIDAHVAGCPACAAFAAQQRRLDARLAHAFPPPTLGPRFRATLRTRIREERTRAAMDALPDIVHFASCGVATLAVAAVIPAAAVSVITIGAAVALATYVVLATVRQSLSEIEQPNR